MFDVVCVCVLLGGGSDYSVNEVKFVYVLSSIYYSGFEFASGWYIKIGGGLFDYFDKSDLSWVCIECEFVDWMFSDGDEVVVD